MFDVEAMQIWTLLKDAMIYMVDFAVRFEHQLSVDVKENSL